MRMVILESPYAGDVMANLAYARAALADSLSRGEAPIASHLLYTQPGVLDDAKPEERAKGVAAGLAWSKVADAAVFYVNFGMSAGMKAAYAHYVCNGLPIEERRLDLGVGPGVPLGDEASGNLMREVREYFEETGFA